MRSGAVWVFRVLWFLLPLTVGQVAADAISSAGNQVPQVLNVGLWIAWAIGVIASVVTLPITLTAARLVAPGVLLVAFWAAVDVGGTALSLVGVAHAIAAVAAVFSQLVGDRFADGASYGEERRMLLRPPTQLAALVLPAAWLATTAALAAGPLLLANHQWVPGIIITAIAAGLVPVVARAVHQLSTRWVVFVPTGLVLHDHNVMTEPVLFRRTAIERLGPAIAGSPARDLTLGAPGLLLECELTDPAPIGLRTGKRDAAPTELDDVRRFLFSPSRPGALLDEAERRGIPVG